MGGEWRPVKLGDLVEVKHGFAFEGRFFRDSPPGDVLVTPGNFKVGGGFNTRNLRYYMGPEAPGFLLSPGDLIVTMTDLSKTGDTLGYAALVPSDGRRYLHNQRIGLVKLKAGADLNLRFAHWLMRTPLYRAEILGGATGSTVRHTSPSRIAEFTFELPLPHEQELIAGVLDALDEKIERNRRKAEALEAIARTLYKSWFIDFDPVHAKANGRSTSLPEEVSSLFPDCFGPDELPEGWSRAPLLDHARLISGGTPMTKEPAYWDGALSWASAKDVSQCPDSFLITTERTITQRGLEESATRLVPKFSTVVVARGATTGRHCLFGREMAMNQTCYALNSVEGTPFWLACSFTHLVDELVRAAHGSVFDTITTTTLGTARVTIDPKVVLAFEDTVRPVYLRILSAIEETSTLQTLREIILPKLLSGELRVSDADKKVSAA